MKKTLSYFALLLVSGLVFSACIPKQAEEAPTEDGDNAMIQDHNGEENTDTMVKDDSESMEKSDDAMVKEEGRTITMEMAGFYYAPNVIEASPGETVTVVVENVGGFHDFVIDELDVATEQVKEGNTVTATFTIPDDASGTEYEFYCSVGNHRAQGMVGTLMIK